MPELSAHYSLTILEAGEDLSENDYAFTRRNITNLDNKAYIGAEAHLHNGDPLPIADPTQPLSLVLLPDEGGIPANRTVRYKYTWVDEHGQETAASPESTISTPVQVAAPGTPSLARRSGGSLLYGNYFYVLTAWKNSNTLETTPGSRAYTTLNFGGGNRTIRVTFPTLPSGADGFNIYRRSPGSAKFQFLTEVDLSVATPPTYYDDDGSETEDCNRTVPTRNTTSNNCAVQVTLPGATPAVPDGFTWKLYRTYTQNDWDSSTLVWVVEETSEGSDVVVPEYLDVGSSTSAGRYPPQSELTASPSKIQMTDMEEVQGTLPVGALIVPALLTFTIPGPVTVANGEAIWVCDFDQAQIIKTRAYLGRDRAPISQSVIADVKKYNGTTWASIYNNAANRPSVPAGQMIGSQYTLVTADTQLLANGNALVVDVIQAGGSATPNDEDLTVSILLYVQVGSATTSHTWAAS